MRIVNGMNAVALAVVLVASAGAPAALTVTNGDFSTGAPASGQNLNDVTAWFDGVGSQTGANTNFFRDTWHSNATQPAGHTGGQVAFSGPAFSPQNFLYQSIGTKDAGDGTLNFSVNVGSFTDAGVSRSGTLYVSLYEQTGLFTPADGTDINGAGGVTQIDSTVSLAVVRTPGVSGVETGSFDLAGVSSTSNPLYLRFDWEGVNNGGSDNGFMALDNVAITVDPVSASIPTPAALPAGLAMLAVVATRSRRA